MLLGVENLVIVRSGKRTLVVPGDRVEEIKDMVRALSED